MSETQRPGRAPRSMGWKPFQCGIPCTTAGQSIRPAKPELFPAAVSRSFLASPKYSPIMSAPDTRWIQRFENYRRALTRLEAAVELSRQRPPADLEQQGMVHAFEFTHELAWNCLKDFLQSRGTADLYGSGDATREAFRNGLIEDGDVWMQMIRDRKQSSHTYNEEVVKEIVAAINADYIHSFLRLQTRLRQLQEENL